MPTHLTDMEITKVALVERGANGRTFAVLKSITAPAVRKDAPTFQQLMAAQDFSSWLPGAVDALSQVIYAAVYDDAPGVTPEQRAQAVVDAAHQFSDALLERSAAAIAKRHVRKRAPSVFAGLL